MRSPSSSNPGYADTPPVLGSGVYVPPPRPTASQQKAVEQPPSSAQRYPELFRPEYAKETSVDGLPANYYQAPVSREDAFLPRTQTNEYQLPGVGPPPDEPRTGRRSRRNSALFKELGGRLSRSVSRMDLAETTMRVHRGPQLVLMKFMAKKILLQALPLKICRRVRRGENRAWPFLEEPAAILRVVHH